MKATFLLLMILFSVTATIAVININPAFPEDESMVQFHHIKQAFFCSIFLAVALICAFNLRKSITTTNNQPHT